MNMHQILVLNEAQRASYVGLQSIEWIKPIDRAAFGKMLWDEARHFTIRQGTEYRVYVHYHQHLVLDLTIWPAECLSTPGTGYIKIHQFTA